MILMKQYSYQMRLSFFPEDLEESRKIHEIKLEHPRDRNDQKFEDLVSEIIDEIGELEDD